MWTDTAVVSLLLPACSLGLLLQLLFETGEAKICRLESCERRVKMESHGYGKLKLLIYYYDVMSYYCKARMSSLKFYEQIANKLPCSLSLLLKLQKKSPSASGSIFNDEVIAWSQTVVIEPIEENWSVLSTKQGVTFLPFYSNYSNSAVSGFLTT